ncbi:uncharacterized protein LOC128957272 [Oppia nitens]|uniref:uncharacterized protein LOC128957272 n=1 Tax=Oppia nitens TaxID=1686743 RepID=UPI0023D9B3B2|nr:uncharacterized protein LOC128957272 [Oppia nitens]
MVGHSVSATDGVECPPKPDPNYEGQIIWEANGCGHCKWITATGAYEDTVRLRLCCGRIDEIQMRFQLYYKLCTITSKDSLDQSYNTLVFERKNQCKNEDHVDYDKPLCDKQPVDLDCNDCLYYRQHMMTANETTVPNTMASSSSSSSDTSVSDTVVVTTDDDVGSNGSPNGIDDTQTTVIAGTGSTMLTNNDILPVTSSSGGGGSDRPDTGNSTTTTPSMSYNITEKPTIGGIGTTVAGSLSMAANIGLDLILLIIMMIMMANMWTTTVPLIN